MRFYPLGRFADISVTSSFAATASFVVDKMPTASYSPLPSGSKGPVGASGGKVFILSSSLKVCVSTTTTTTTTLAPGTTTTTTTTTAAPVCGGLCTKTVQCVKAGGPSCDCLPWPEPGSEVYKCQSV